MNRRFGKFKSDDKSVTCTQSVFANIDMPVVQIIDGISQSVVFCPILSWYDDDTGSVGNLLKLQPPVHDNFDKTLLGEPTHSMQAFSSAISLHGSDVRFAAHALVCLVRNLGKL